MTADINLQPEARAWLAHSVLYPHVSRYADHLERGRYALNTRRVYLCCVAHFALWLTQNEVAIGGIDESTVTRFVSGHLPHCDCPYPVRRGVHDIEAALRQLLQVLRVDGLLPPRVAPGQSHCEWPGGHGSELARGTWAEDRATRGRDPSAVPGAKTGVGGRMPPLGSPGLASKR